MSLTEESLINFDHIQQKTIRNYILDKGLTDKADFDNLANTSYNKSEKETYHRHSKIFTVEADLDTVWDTYLNISPNDTWKSKMVSFGCMYSKKSRKLTYLNDQYEGLKEGQILFLNISLFWGLVNIAVAHQIVKVNKDEKYIEFSYIEGGETEGSQRLSFTDNKNGTTNITHLTTYRGKSSSFLRERILYPFLHGKVISAFHHNVKQKILLSKS